MQLTLSTLAVATFVVLVQAASQEFGIVISHLAHAFHLLLVGIAGGKLQALQSTTITWQVQDDGSLKSSDGQYVSVGLDGTVVAGSTPLAGWSVSNGDVVFGSTGFYVDSTGVITTKLPTPSDSGISLMAFLSSGSRAADFVPGGTKGSSAGVTSAAPATSAAAKTTAAPVTQITDGQIQATTKTTVAPVTQITDGQIQATTVTPVVVSQIGDGQIQATTSTHASVAAATNGAPLAQGGALAALAVGLFLV